MSEVESINPNTPVTSNLTKDGTIESDATGGPLSFDELEEVTSKSKKTKKTYKPYKKMRPLQKREPLWIAAGQNRGLFSPLFYP